MLWSFQGKLLLEEKKKSFYQFLWRPRPRSLLTDKEYAEVVRNLKKYQRKYNEMDRMKDRERNEKKQSHKREMLQEHDKLVQKRAQAIMGQRAGYIACLDGYDSENENEYIIQTTTHDKVLSQKEEIVRKKKMSILENMLSPSPYTMKSQ